METTTYVQIHFHNAHMKKRALILHAVDAASQCHMKNTYQASQHLCSGICTVSISTHGYYEALVVVWNWHTM